MNKYIKRSIAVLGAAALTFSFSTGNTVYVEAAKTLSQLQSERNDLAQKTKEAKEKLAEIQNKQASVQEEIEVIDNMLASVQKELDQSEADLEDVTARLEQSEADLAQAEKDKERQMETFSKRVNFFYEQGDIGYVDVIFESESFSDMLSRMQYVQDIMEYDDNLLDELKKNQELIEEKTKEIEEEKKNAEELVNLQEEKRDEILNTMEEKNALLASYQQDEANYEEYISQQEEASKEVERLIRQSTVVTSDSASTYVYTGGQLNWPVPSRAASPSSLSSGFVNRMSPVGRGYEKHTGYDIPASYGSAIVAAESGTVIYSGWMNGYGNTIMIDHGGGIVTLYGHNSSLTVSKGEAVSRGQQVAKCGSTGYSTGNHCHFEVRVNGTAVSPESFLGVPNVAY